MAAIEKYSCGSAGVCNLLKHNSRDLLHSSNQDIQPNLSHLNYSLTPPDHGDSEYAYYQHRLSEVYVYNRKDVVTMCGIVCTLPADIPLDDSEQINRFFSVTNDFLVDRYGGEDGRNVVSSWVHFDEGKRLPVYDRFTGDPILDQDGNVQTELVVGRPHLHFDFIPVVNVDLEYELSKKRHDPKIEQYAERVCANDVLTRSSYRSFHGDWQRYLEEHGIDARVKTGVTKAQGGNIPVSRLKDRFDSERSEMDRLREIERQYNEIISRHPELLRDGERRGRFD